MQDFFREHFQSAMRDLAINIIRILFTSISLSLVGKNHLNMPFRAQSSTFQQSNLAFHASTIHVSSGLDIIQGISNYG